MIQITSDIRSDLSDIDNISNLLNYAVVCTLNKHYSNQTDEEKLKTSKNIIIGFLQGKTNLISNWPCPIHYPDDEANGIRGLRNLLETVDPKLIQYSILNWNILSHAYTKNVCKKIGGYNAHEEIAKGITDITANGFLDQNIDNFFKNKDFLNSMVFNYVDMTFNDDIRFYNNIINVGYSDPQISKALEQLNLECSLDKVKGNVI